MVSKLTIERFGPIWLGLSVGVLLWLRDLNIPYSFAKELLAALISAASVCAGFLTTALSILMTLGSTAIGRQLQRRKKEKLLFGYIRSAIFGCLILAVASVIGFFFISESEGIGTVGSALLGAISAFSLASIARIIEILIRVFESMSSENN